MHHFLQPECLAVPVEETATVKEEVRVRVRVRVRMRMDVRVMAESAMIC